MSGPTPQDPLGLSPLEQQLRDLVDSRIRLAWRTNSGGDFSGVPDAMLCMELIARGWVVYKPHHPEHPDT